MILSGQVSSPAGGGPETVEVRIASKTSLASYGKINYYDGVTFSNITKVLSDINVGDVFIIPKDSLIVIYGTGTGYSPYIEEASSASVLITTIGREEQQSLYWNNVYKISGNCSISLNQTCLIAGTLITLSNGTTKKVEDITYDDELLVWDFFNGCFTSAKPRWIKIKQTSPVYNKLTFSNGATLGLVGEGGTQGYHRIYNKQAGLFTHTGVPETPIGTITFAEDETEPVLVKQELINEEVDYYNIITDKHFNLFANGILTSCKCSNMYRIEDMKYVGERLMSDEEIEKYFEWHEPLKLAK